MRLVREKEVGYRDRNGFRSSARVRVYEPNEPILDQMVVLATHDLRRPSLPLLGDPERLASEVLVQFGLPFPVVFIEHNIILPEAFHLVHFDRCEECDGRVLMRGITWREVDRRTVEALVGEEIGR